MSPAEQLARMRACGVPIVAWESADPIATLDTIAGAAPDAPIVAWDAAVGPSPRTTAGAEILASSGAAEPDPYGGAPDPGAFLAQHGPALAIEGAIVVMQGAHRYLAAPRFAAGVLRIRESYKARGAILVMLGTGLEIPADLAAHCERIREALPGEEERGRILRSVYDAAGIAHDDETIARAVGSTRGLSAFGAEQAAALAMRPTGLDLDELRRRWRDAVDAVPGLRLDDTRRTVDDLAGLASIKRYASIIGASAQRFGAVVLIDEIARALGGAGGDNTGVSQDQELILLQLMQDTRADGLILQGPAGTGKTATAQAIAAVFGVPLINWDLGAAKAKHVGESEANIRRAAQTIRALAGRPFVVGTANDMQHLKPELRRRFRSGIWFSDLPTAEEREAIRSLYSARYRIDPSAPWPDIRDWTGAEIETAAERADALQISPAEAGEWIVPVARMAPEVIDAMRRHAAGCYLSTSYHGVYRYAAGAETAPSAPAGRRFAPTGGKE